MKAGHVLPLFQMKLANSIPLSGPAAIATVALGLLAISATLGAFAGLPPAAAFFLSVVPVALFPGAVLYSALRPEGEDGATFAEGLTVAFVCGLALLLLLGFAGIVFRLRLNTLAVALTVIFAALVALLILRQILAGRDPVYPGGFSGNRAAVIILVALAVLLAAATLWSPRDMDDWFYLAYISDYVEGQPINSTDALMGPEWSSPPRVWFGAWWVAEALFSHMSGVHPVDCHQVYLPLLIFPFAVLGVFALARQIFGSVKVAYLACFLQVLFYLSSACPSDSAGWALFARTAQDKSLAFLIPTVVASALGLKFLRRSYTRPEGPGRRLYALYFISAVAAGLVHPMGLVWCAVVLLPFALVELLRDRRRRPATALALLLVPLVLCGLMLQPGAGATSLLEDIAPGPHEGRGLATVIAPHVPGGQTRPVAGDRILGLGAGIYIAHPLLVTRYPMAVAGLVLTFFMLPWWRESRTARLLMVLTGSVLVLAYVPGIAGFAAGIMTRKMLYRLTWLLPWGFTIAFFLSRLGRRMIWGWVIAIVVMLALCRGNPQNYFSLMAAMREGARPSPEFVEAALALNSEPAPRGIVLAPTNTGMMIPAYVSAAYPAFVSPAYSTIYRSERARTPRDMRKILGEGFAGEDFAGILDDLGCRYIFVRVTSSMATGLRTREAEYRPVFSNSEYGIWKVSRRDASGD
jgi:hypothetical protein